MRIYSIQANRFDGYAWGTAQLVETNNASDADSPQIAMDGTARAIAVWAQYDGSGVAIRSNRFE